MLTDSQALQIYQNGFVQLSGLVSQKHVNAALRAINHSVGQGMNRKDIESFRSRSFCPELLGKPPIVDLLYDTPLMKLAESATVSGLKRAGAGQIAWRFPWLE